MKGFLFIFDGFHAAKGLQLPLCAIFDRAG
jgi:hypothetical protein